eukprot:1231550-Pleurochrysis_carterae.AAC.3
MTCIRETCRADAHLSHLIDEVWSRDVDLGGVIIRSKRRTLSDVIRWHAVPVCSGTREEMRDVIRWHAVPVCSGTREEMHLCSAEISS